MQDCVNHRQNSWQTPKAFDSTVYRKDMKESEEYHGRYLSLQPDLAFELWKELQSPTVNQKCSPLSQVQ